MSTGERREVTGGTDRHVIDWTLRPEKALKQCSPREFGWVIRSVDPDQSGVLDRYLLRRICIQNSNQEIPGN